MLLVTNHLRPGGAAACCCLRLATRVARPCWDLSQKPGRMFESDFRMTQNMAIYIYGWLDIYIYNRIKICDLDEPWSSEKKSHSETYHLGMVPNTFSTKIGKGTSRPVARFFGMWTIYRLYRLRHNHMGEEPTRAWIPYGWNCWAPVACRTLFQAAKHVCNKCSTMQA